MFLGKPIIGLTGGIGSGKSTVAGMFGDLGCLVIDSDQQVRQAYRDRTVIDALREQWGAEILSPDGQVNRKAIAGKIFTDSVQRQWLQNLLHPIVKLARDRAMALGATNPQVLAFVWDTPLLFETSLHRDCDAVLFVAVPFADRLVRVGKSRGWKEEELTRRENLQWPLDKKRKISDYVIDNTADAEFVRGQVSQVLSRILARSSPPGA